MIRKVSVIAFVTNGFFLTTFCFAQSGLTMTSPDKKIVVNFFTIKGRSFYILKYNGQAILDSSETGLKLDKQSLTPDLQLNFSKKYVIQSVYPSVGFHSRIINHCNGYVIKPSKTFRNLTSGHQNKQV